MLQTSPRTSHSATVNLQLEVGDQLVPLSQVAPDWIIAGAPQNLTSCDGIVIMTIDGREHRLRVNLPQGMSPEMIKTPVVRLRD